MNIFWSEKQNKKQFSFSFFVRREDTTHTRTHKTKKICIYNYLQKTKTNEGYKPGCETRTRDILRLLSLDVCC